MFVFLKQQQVSDATTSANVPLRSDLNSALMHKSDERKNEIATTWSYSTSEEPARAGKESDVFVGECDCEEIEYTELV